MTERTTTTSDDRVTSGPLLDLHDELLAAARRRTAESSSPARGRRPVRRPGFGRPLTPLLAAAATALLVGAGIVVFTIAGSTDVAADVAVERSGDVVTVSIEEEVTVSEIVRALRDADVDVTVEPRTTGPSRINRFVGVINSESAKLVGGDGTSSATASFEAGADVTLQLGVAATDDAPYEVVADAAAENEPFDGLDVEGKPLGSVKAAFDRRAERGGFTVTYRQSDGTEVATPDDSARIASTLAVSRDHVVVVLG